MLDSASSRKMKGVLQPLVNVVNRAHRLARAKGLDFRVTEGLRSRERQVQLMVAGASTTMNSRHLTGHAIDFVPLVAGEPNWKWPAFWPLVECFEQAATELGVMINCGARWKTFPDGPHVELSRQHYP
jgi:peptidoglycan L-alanyl-D-glutamate endopeptidase CwlK